MDLESILNSLGLSLNLAEFQEAFTHSSYKQVDPTSITYERMETLGDAVLDLLVTKYLIDQEPDISPGNLTQSRSTFVNNHSLYLLGISFDIKDHIRKSDSYILQKGDLADIVEAIFGTIFYYHGYPMCKTIFNQIITLLPTIPPLIAFTRDNPVGQLQELLQTRSNALPLYQVMNEQGPDHEKIFTIKVIINLNGHEYTATAEGNSKKQAKKSAARLLLKELRVHSVIT